MNFKDIIALAFLSVAAATPLVAQTQMNLPTTQIGGVEFYRYDTSNGDSNYDMAAKLGVTKDFIIQNTPDAADGISGGMTLYFPVEANGKAAATASGTATAVHVVEQGETLYGLAKRYGVTIDDLIASNPNSENGLKVGQKLVIPSTSTAHSTRDANQEVINAFSNSTAQIAVAQTGDPVIHEMKDGESIYTLAKQYNSTIEGIITPNPGLEPDEYIAGARVKVIPNSALPFIYERTSRRNYKYEVKRGETFASIAKDNGISEEELKAVNPDMK